MALSTRGIVGVSVGGGFLAVIVAYIVWILHKRKRRAGTSTWPPSDPEKTMPKSTTTSQRTISAAPAAKTYTSGTGVPAQTSTKISATKKSGGGGGGGGIKHNNNNGRLLEVVVVDTDCGSPAPRDTHAHSNAVSRGYNVSDHPVQHTSAWHGYSGGYGGGGGEGGGGYGGGGYGGGGEGGSGGCSSGGGGEGGGGGGGSGGGCGGDGGGGGGGGGSCGGDGGGGGGGF